MKKSKAVQVLLTVGLLSAGGCALPPMRVEIADPSVPVILPTGALPQAVDDPEAGAENKVPEKKKIQPEIRKDVVLQPEAKAVQSSKKKTVDPTAVKTEVPAAAEKKPEKKIAPDLVKKEVEQPKKKQPIPGRHSPENFRRGPGIWRAFSRLPQEEQRELIKLQRTDPERYRSIMQEKADQLYAREHARRQELDALAAAYHACKDENKKAELRKELRLKLHEDFRQRLQDTRRDIDSHKRRTAFLEAELQKREKNCEAIVDAMLNNRLQAKVPESTVLSGKTEKK